jgi:hypothetical protein
LAEIKKMTNKVNKGNRIIGSSVLIFEAIVILLAIPVAILNYDVSANLATLIGVPLAVIAMLIPGGFGRGWAIWAGGAFQAVVLLATFLLPPMLFVALLFSVLWFGGLVVVRRADRIRAQRFGSV